jgi:MarR family transcriptional regulator, temperature-dependent positive regulator of motility
MSGHFGHDIVRPECAARSVSANTASVAQCRRRLLVAEAGIDLTSVQFSALAVIGATPGIDQATLANAIAFDRPTTGGVVDRLEAKGFVRREITKADRRMRHLYLEPAGKPVLDGATPIVRRVQDLMLEGLSETERATFLRLLSKALRAVGESSRPALRSAPTIRGSGR